MKMELKVSYNYQKKMYIWSLYDGPDGIDYYEGHEESLGGVFEAVNICRTIIGLQYTKE